MSWNEVGKTNNQNQNGGNETKYLKIPQELQQLE